MLWQLIKRDPAFRGIRWSALIAAAVAARVPHMYPLVLAAAAFTGFAHQRATRFQAALPVSAARLLEARLCSLVLAIWVPALVGAVAASLTRSCSALSLLGVATVFTAIVMLMQSFRLRQVAGPRWLSVVVFSLSGVVPVLVTRAGLPLVAASAVVAIAAAIRNRCAAPAAFQFAPQATRGEAPAAPGRERNSAAGAAWKPFVRSCCGPRQAFFLLCLPLMALTGQWLTGLWWVGFLWLTMRQGLLWLWALPVRRSAVLPLLLAPMLLALSAGIAFRPLLPSRRPVLRDPGGLVFETILMFAAVSAAVLMVNVLLDSPRLLRVNAKLRQAAFLAILFIPSAVMILSPSGAVFSRPPETLARLWSAFPGGLLIAAAASLAAALYWTLNKTFAEAECAERPRATADNYYA